MNIVEKIKELGYRRYALVQEIQAINSHLLIQYEQLFLAASRGEVDVTIAAKYLNDRDEQLLKKFMPVLSEASSVVKSHQEKQQEPGQQKQQEPEQTGRPESNFPPRHVANTIPVEEPLSTESQPSTPNSLVVDSQNIQPIVAKDPVSVKKSDDDDDVDDKTPITKPIPESETPQSSTKETSFEESVEKIKESAKYKLNLEMNEKNINDYKKRIEGLSDEKKFKYKKQNLPLLTEKIKNMEKAEVSKDPSQYLANQITLSFYKECLKCLETI